MPHTLVVTNDYPPRAGGIQAFVQGLVSRQPADSITVYAPAWKRAAEFDAAQPFEVVRHPTSLMLPEPMVISRAVALLKERSATRVLFGAAAPLGLMAGKLRAAGAEHIVALTHGHEAGWASLPVARAGLRRIGDRVDTVTYLGEYTRRRIAAAMSPAAAARMRRLVPGVDDEAFHPRNREAGAFVRASYGLADRPVVVCVSRLMPRKGQDTLIEALPLIRRQVPDAALLIVGGGPYRKHLEKLVDDTGMRAHVKLTGTVPWEELPAHFAAGDVFAMPCRTRNRGLDVEGLGIVYLEASATGLPVVAGDSGGAPDAVVEGETGYVVPGGDPAAAAERVAGLLADPERARTMGSAGRRWIESYWRWELISDRLSVLLAGDDPDASRG
jgi:phosphatidylinositol alpha-1,6-mannosyltransferase